MWVKATTGTLVNLDQMASIYVKGNKVVCAAHRYSMETPCERILGEYPTHEDADIVLRLISGALHINDENLLYMPNLESLDRLKKEIEESKNV